MYGYFFIFCCSRLNVSTENDRRTNSFHKWLVSIASAEMYVHVIQPID